jgi:uncharacterized membrane protein YgdD (TMEM256/DUF423 family)
MNRSLFVAATFFGMTAVILGAFGAHALQKHLDAEEISWFQTGVRYQMWHALALLGISSLSENLKVMKWVPGVFMAGIVLFSGSLYLLACRPLFGGESWSWLGPITPLGGLCLIVGWGGLLVSGVRGARNGAA